MTEVEKIHRDFYGAITQSEVALEKNLKELLATIGGISLSGSELQAYGAIEQHFSNASDVVSTKKRREQLKSLKEEESDITAFLREIQEFHAAYPYKLIHYTAIDTICKKYDLIFGPSVIYKQAIPERNAIEIANFLTTTLANKENRKKYEDKRYSQQLGMNSSKVLPPLSSFIWSHTNSTIPLCAQKFGQFDHHSGARTMYIAGPATYFDTKGYNIIGRELFKDIPEKYAQLNVPAIIPKDPVVMVPLTFKSKIGQDIGMFAIITAWGLEAQDPLVKKDNLN